MKTESKAHSRCYQLIVPSFFALALATVVMAGQAKATVVIDVNQVGGNVVFSVTGSLNMGGAIPVIDHDGHPDVDPAYQIGFIPGGNNWYIAPGLAVDPPPNFPCAAPCGGPVAFYHLTSFDVPFGTSPTFFHSPISSSGDAFHIWGNVGHIEQFAVPQYYISGSAIVSEMVFSGSIAELTLIPGEYNFTFPSDKIVLKIHAVTAVP